jgi:hypothetical protein
MSAAARCGIEMGMAASANSGSVMAAEYQRARTGTVSDVGAAERPDGYPSAVPGFLWPADPSGRKSAVAADNKLRRRAPGVRLEPFECRAPLERGCCG